MRIQYFITSLGILACGAVQAQSSVVTYGKVDVGIAKITGQPYQETYNHSSRLGFKGSEDLGGGLSATFQFEHRFNADTGASQNATAFWKAQSNVGLKGGFGTVRLGRIYNPVDEIAIYADPFGQDGVGAMLLNQLAVTRQNNSVRYDSPTFAGFSVQAIYSFKESATPVPANSQNGAGVSLNYINGPVSLALGWNQSTISGSSIAATTQFGTLNLTDAHYWAASGGYDFGVAKVTALYEKVGTDQDSQRNAMVALFYKVGSGAILANAGRLTTEVPGQSIAEKKYSLGYNHFMSKRTTLYADASTYSKSVANSKRINGVDLGISHNF